LATRWFPVALGLVVLLHGGAFARGPELTEPEKQELDRNWQLVLQKKKGPYSQNFCVCRNGDRQPVMKADGTIQTPCGGRMQFCAAWREPWAEALAAEGMYVGNL
jgi:hypothetical protein